jgi:hypothetical protein
MPLLLASVLVASCGASSGSSQRLGSRSVGTAATPCGIRASTVARESEQGPGLALLQTAEVSRAECTDDVRFDFTSSDVDLPPRYIVEYQPGPFIDVNQDVPASPEGTAYLVVRFEAAATELGGRTTYRSRESITPGGMHHLEDVRMVRAPDNTVQFVIGLDEQRPFVVDGAPSPPHVVVRIA